MFFLGLSWSSRTLWRQRRKWITGRSKLSTFCRVRIKRISRLEKAQETTARLAKVMENLEGHKIPHNHFPGLGSHGM